MRTLKDLGNKVPFNFPSSPKRWYGSPIAAIMCGVVAIGTLSNGMPQAEVDLLRKLQDLYSRELPKDDIVESTTNNDDSSRISTIPDEKSSNSTNQPETEANRTASSMSTSAHTQGQNLDLKIS